MIRHLDDLIMGVAVNEVVAELAPKPLALEKSIVPSQQ
jgi:hypothetical protein